MAMTSGTTAAPKIYPIIKSYKLKTMWICLGVLYKFKSLLSLGRTQDFRLWPTPREAPCGLPMAGITSHLFKPMPHHVTHPGYKNLYKEKTAFYAHAVFLLAERDMRCIEGFSSNLLYSFFKVIEQNIKSICRDIEKGEIGEEFGISDDIRREMNQHLRSDPERANFIRKEFSKGKLALIFIDSICLLVDCSVSKTVRINKTTKCNDFTFTGIKRIGKRIWPGLHYVTCAKNWRIPSLCEIARKFLSIWSQTDNCSACRYR